MAFWPRLDNALYNDGRIRLVDLETRGIQISKSPAGILSRTTRTERGVVTSVLRFATTRHRLRRNRSSLVRGCCHDLRFLECESLGVTSPAPLPRLGIVCFCAELHALADELGTL